MEKTVLFAGKEYPDGKDLAKEALSHNRNAVITIPFSIEEQEEKNNSENFITAMWNRSSSVSARSLVLQVENSFRKIDEAVLVFDTCWFAKEYHSLTPENCSRAVDTMMSSYLYLSTELINRMQKQGGGTIVFLLKAAPALGETISTEILPTAAEGMFKSLAEAIAAKYADQSEIKIVLLRAEHDATDGQFAGWMFEYLDILYTSKVKLDIRHAVQWAKIGSKPATGLSSFFRK